MSFLTPLFFIGAAAIAAPILVHLVRRTRARRVEFPTLYFVRQVPQRTIRRRTLQNVLLLSGGEKALTALALLISLFRYKPSPFCVLDEVDAPLDEANVDRFAQVVRNMSAQTQFIVITHSKRTMETASALYGVTMEEPGISKIVSVRLN